MKALLLFFTIFPTLIFSQTYSSRDIVINEIMFDPSPTVELPNAEYIELYNNSESDINLNNWTLSINSKEYKISDFTLKSKNYVIITSTKNEGVFTSTEPIYLKISSLSNSGAEIKIASPDGFIVDDVKYSPMWHKNKLKQNGGWSLELINPENNCVIAENWNSSDNESGGTPGFENSIYNNEFFPKTTNYISEIFLNDDFDKISIILKSKITSKSIDIESNSNLPFYTSSKNNSDGTTTIEIDLQGRTIQNKTHFVLSNLKSCNGENIDTDTIWIGPFEKAEFNDIVINEIMFNPKTPGDEFVELYNKSDKFINLKNYAIANFINTDEESSFENLKTLSDKNIFIAPKEYLVITKHINNVTSTYKSGKFRNFIQTKSLPKMNNDNGKLAIINRSLNAIDKVAYSNDMHNNLMRDEKRKGVSIERINPSNPSLDFENYSSASQSCGGATPALRNSTTIVRTDISDNFTVIPKSFSPTGRSDNTISNLFYKLDKSGFIANVKIFNSQGLFIKEIANNYLMGVEGSFSWDGTDYNNSTVSNGIYIYWIEIFNTKGDTKIYKKIVSLY